MKRCHLKIHINLFQKVALHPGSSASLILLSTCGKVASLPMIDLCFVLINFSIKPLSITVIIVVSSWFSLVLQI